MLLRALLVPCLVFAAAVTVDAQIIISEFMADNNVTLDDVDGDSPDWIELTNTGSFLDIGGRYLTDDAGNPTKWMIPSPTYLFSNTTIVIFASDKDRAIAGQELHTNFKLSSGGEYVGLIDTDGVTVLSEFAPSYPTQIEDVSFGVSFSGITPQAQTGYFVSPSPGGINGTAGAAVGDVDHQPSLPGNADTIVVEAEVETPAGITTAAVQLRYRVNYSGETTVTMTDNGVGADVTAGDGVWTAVIPASVSSPGQMVRWRVTTVDGAGGPGGLQPLFPDPVDSPEYFGTMIADPAVTSPLGIYNWWVQSTFLATTTNGTRCSVFFNGEFYDNVFVRRRGNSSSGWPKKNYKFDFNRGDHFRFDPVEGRVEELNLNSTWSDKSFMRRILCWETYRDAGVAGSLALPWRVERNGSFYSVAIFVEQPDAEMLERTGLDENGALYKMFNTCTSAYSGVEKKTRLFEGNSDLAALVSGVQTSGTTLENYLFDNVDLPAVANYLAATVIIHDNDHLAKNYYVYRDTEGDGEWRFLPWDKDLTLGRNYTLGGGVLNDTMWATTPIQSHPLLGDQGHPKVDGFWNRFIDGCYRNPRMRRMTMRRVRTLMEAQLDPPGTASPVYETRIAQLTVDMNADVALDQASWGVPSWGSSSLTFTAAINQLVTSYLEPRRTHLFVTHGSAGGIIPPSQLLYALSLGAIEHSPVSGNPSEQFIEITNCGATDVDVSGWTLSGSINFEMPPGAVLLAGEAMYVAADPVAFRARTSGPSGGQGLFVVGPWSGGYLNPASNVSLDNEFGSNIDALNGGLQFDVATTGVGDVAISVAGAGPISELFLLYSTQGLSSPAGCGPLFGVGNDAFLSVLLPVGSHPFHVYANGAGQYSFGAPAGSVPVGFTVDARAINLVLSPLSLRVSAVVRRTF